MTTKILKLSVDGASYDEAEVMAVADTPPVRCAIRSWETACEFYGDGSIEMEETDGTGLQVMSEAEFLDTAANAIGADAEEVAELPGLWRAGREWRRA